MSAANADTVVVRFEGVSVAEAGKKIVSLRERVLDACPGAKADIRKDDPTTQDFGTTLVILLGTPAVLALAKGIAAYLARGGPGTLVIEKDGKVVFRGNSADAAAVAKALGEKAK